MHKIAIVTPYGAVPFLENYAEFILARSLQNLGHRIRFYTYRLRSHVYYGENGVYKGVKAFRCRERFGFAPGLFFSLLFFRPKVVMLFHPKNRLNFSAYLAARFIGAKVITEIVGILHDPYIVNDTDNPIVNVKNPVYLITKWKDLTVSFFSGHVREAWNNFIIHMPTAKADIIVSINKDEQNYVKKFYGRDSEVVYWCMGKESSGAVIKPRENVYGKIPNNYLLFLAQVKKRKGWDTVLESLKFLKNEGIKKNLIYVCPSKNVEEVKNYAKSLGILDQIFFLIQISNEEKNWLYNHAQYVLVPSRYEGFGLPIFEAFQANKPVLATDIPVFLEFLKHRKNAMISPVGDGKALAQNIKILDSDPGLASGLVAEGEKSLVEFSEEKMVGKFLKIINNLLG